jgi:hypothetical protein
LLVVLGLFFVALLWFGIQVVPRIVRRHPSVAVPVHSVLDKRYIDPVPGDTTGQSQRFQLLLEDEDGRQVWTWCDAEAFSIAEPGDTYARGHITKR